MVASAGIWMRRQTVGRTSCRWMVNVTILVLGVITRRRLMGPAWHV
jgi:hypothetical protein